MKPPLYVTLFLPFTFSFFCHLSFAVPDYLAKKHFLIFFFSLGGFGNLSKMKLVVLTFLCLFSGAVLSVWPPNRTCAMLSFLYFFDIRF